MSRLQPLPRIPVFMALRPSSGSRLRLTLSLLCLLWKGSWSFPNSASPITAGPPVTHVDEERLCSVALITNASCDGWDKVVTQLYTPPSPDDCSGTIEKVVLEFHGTVKGVQFDRFGALFLGPVELLRTSTPEPNPRGIRWSIYKDVTRYLSLFLSDDGPTMLASLSIPNNVDSTYTGIFYVNATLHFYGSPSHQPQIHSPEFFMSSPPSGPLLSAHAIGAAAKDTIKGSLRASHTPRPSSNNRHQHQQHRNHDGKGHPATSSSSSSSSPSSPSAMRWFSSVRMARSAPVIVPLIDPVGTGHWPWSTLSITGNQSLNTTVHWPVSNVVRASLDVYASNHQCEEFWYTNLPDEDAATYGFCGGGVYREIQVYVNGVLAGISYPYFVIYTGGINPLLWRPLSGIMSFDMGPYRFDLTPFVGVLNQAGKADITIKVLGNNGDSGLWYVNGVLVLHTDHHYHGKVLPGTLLSSSDSGAKWNVTRSTEPSSQGRTFVTAGSHSFSVHGRLDYPDGTHVTTSVTTDLHATNNNQLVGASTQVSTGLLFTETAIKTGGGVVHTVDQWPYNVTSTYREDKTTMDLSAHVKVSFERSMKLVPALVDGDNVTTSSSPKPFQSRWSNDINTMAIYNRTLDHTHTNFQRGMSHEDFGISTTKQGSCYHRKLYAEAGWIDLDVGSYDCVLPAGLSFCDYHICTSVGHHAIDHPSAAGGGGGGGVVPSSSTVKKPGHVKVGTLPMEGGEEREGNDGGGDGVDDGHIVKYLPGRNPLQRARKVTPSLRRPTE